MHFQCIQITKFEAGYWKIGKKKLFIKNLKNFTKLNSKWTFIVTRKMYRDCTVIVENNKLIRIIVRFISFYTLQLQLFWFLFHQSHTTKRWASISVPNNLKCITIILSPLSIWCVCVDAYFFFKKHGQRRRCNDDVNCW